MTGGANDHRIEQDWRSYSEAEHRVWRTLFRRQAGLLPGRAADEFMEGLARFEVASDEIPDFDWLSDMLMDATGWRVIAVPGLVPDDVFFAHLAARRFPAARFIRRADQLDYIEEPDVFHDVFGHVPLLFNPVFANFMEAYGRAGLAAADQGVLHRLARLYWYTVEFGLIRRPEGLRIYGAGIVSSRSESVFALDDMSPNRVMFDLGRVMRTDYRIDDFQETYFVVDDYETLFRAVDRDLTPVYQDLGRSRDLRPSDIDPADTVLTRGTGVYAASSKVA